MEIQEEQPKEISTKQLQKQFAETIKERAKAAAEQIINNTSSTSAGYIKPVNLNPGAEEGFKELTQAEIIKRLTENRKAVPAKKIELPFWVTAADFLYRNRNIIVLGAVGGIVSLAMYHRYFRAGEAIVVAEQSELADVE